MSLLATKIAQCANTNPNTFIEQSLAATLGQHFQSGLDKKSAITTVLTSLNAFDPTQYATYWAQLITYCIRNVAENSLKFDFEAHFNTIVSYIFAVKWDTISKTSGVWKLISPISDLLLRLSDGDIHNGFISSHALYHIAECQFLKYHILSTATANFITLADEHQLSRLALNVLDLENIESLDCSAEDIINYFYHGTLILIGLEKYQQADELINALLRFPVEFEIKSLEFAMVVYCLLSLLIRPLNDLQKNRPFHQILKYLTFNPVLKSECDFIDVILSQDISLSTITMKNNHYDPQLTQSEITVLQDLKKKIYKKHLITSVSETRSVYTQALVSSIEEFIGLYDGDAVVNIINDMTAIETDFRIIEKPSDKKQLYPFIIRFSDNIQPMDKVQQVNTLFEKENSVRQKINDLTVQIENIKSFRK